jgi:LPS export ABC transporter permease LptF/LPS export ABC transporter permease LptG
MEATTDVARTETTTTPAPVPRFRLTRLDRYVVGEILRQLGIAGAALTIILMSGPLIDYVELIGRKGLSLGWLFYLLALTVPAVAALVLPIGFLMAVLVAFSRMGADMELAALRTLGWSLRRLAVPVLGTALLVAGLTWSLTAFGMPWSNRRLSLTVIELSFRRSFTGLQPQVFFGDLPEGILYVREVAPGGTRWQDVLFVDRRDPRFRSLIVAREASVRDVAGPVPRVQITFREGHIYRLEFGQERSYHRSDFERLEIVLQLGLSVTPEHYPKSDREMTLGELRRAMATRSPDELYYKNLAVEYHKRWAIPCAAIVFALIGYPLSVRHARSGRFYGYAVSMAIMLVAYIGLLLGEHLGDQGRIPPWLAAWNPHLLLGLPAIVLWARLDRPVRRTWRIRWPTVERLVPAWVDSRGPWRRWSGLTYVDSYLMRIWARYFITVSLALMSVYLLVEAFHLVDDIVRSQAPLSALVLYVVFAAPGFYHQLLPMILAMSLMVTMAVLEKFREVTAMKAHGISYYRVMAPLLALTTVVAVLDFGLQERILPRTSQVATAYKQVVKGRSLQPTLAVQWLFGQRGYLYHFDAFDSTRREMFGFDMYGLNPVRWQVDWHCQARQAVFRPEAAGWYLQDAWCYEFHPTSRFTRYPQALARLPEPPAYFESTQPTPEQMSLLELRRYIRELQRKGYRSRSWEVYWAMKWVAPLGGLVLFPLAMALALQGARLGTAYGIVVALLIGFLHWLLVQFAQMMGFVEVLPPWAAAGLPYGFTLFVGLWLLTRIRT